MSTAFIGLSVLVKLKSPPAVLQGLVADVQGQRLSLHNVTFFPSGKKLKEYSVHALEIDDIEVVQEEVEEAAVEEEQEAHGGLYEYNGDALDIGTPRSLQSPSGIHPTHTVVLRPAQVLPSKQFVDPAILSYGRRPSKGSQQTPSTDVQVPHHSRLPSAMPTVAQDILINKDLSSKGHRHELPETQTKTFDYLVFDNKTHEVDQAEVVVTADGASSRNESISIETPAAALETIDNTSIPTSKLGHRANRRKKRQELPTVDDQPSSPEVVVKQPQTTATSNGWRETPILQEQTATAQPPTSSNKLRVENKKSRRRRALEAEQAQNGWATEDATDVQEMGDFDFASNLANFDKKTVFDQLREADTTADEDRLVSFNRVAPRPGTFGGKNLHPSEMVLDPRPPVKRGSKDFGGLQDSGIGMAKRLSASGGHMSESSEVEGGGDRNGSVSSSRLLKRDFSRSSARPLQASGSSRKSSGAVPGERVLSPAQLPQLHHHHHHHHLSKMPSNQALRSAKLAVLTQLGPLQQDALALVQSPLSQSQHFSSRRASPTGPLSTASTMQKPMTILSRRAHQQEQQLEEEEEEEQELQDAPPATLAVSVETLNQLEEWGKVQVKAGNEILHLVERIRAGRM